jgi:dTDP-4-dehydrorhamnose reductase
MKQQKPIILVIGSKGQVGQELQVLQGDFSQFDFVFVDVEELDITHKKIVDVFFSKNKFAYCINCAAYTAVDKAETEPDVVWKVNVNGVRHLATACAFHDIPFLQLSTDYVYHNDQNTPFKEADPTSPKGVYAKTKLEGDNSALSIHPAGAMVIRTSWVYSSFGNNFVKTMLRLGADHPELRVIYDQIGTPTYARDLAAAMLTILQQVENKTIGKEALTGIYHYSNEGVTSWYDFALAVFELRNMPVKVVPIETKDYPTPAQRPNFSVLNKAKIKSVFGLKIPHWRQSLEVCLGEIAGGN